MALPKCNLSSKRKRQREKGRRDIWRNNDWEIFRTNESDQSLSLKITNHKQNNQKEIHTWMYQSETSEHQRQRGNLKSSQWEKADYLPKSDCETVSKCSISHEIKSLACWKKITANPNSSSSRIFTRAKVKDIFQPTKNWENLPLVEFH